MSDEEAAVRVCGIVTRFGEQVVHNGVSFDIRRGEILGLVGPSGSGKSVLLREIIGLDEPTDGHIEYMHVDGRTPRIGVMFQDGALFSNLTLLENVEVPLREHTRLPARLREEVAAVKLVMAGLDASAHHKQPAQISGGMRKRAAVARALAMDPELLFLDEPTAGLDPISAENFDNLIKELSEALGLTTVIVTHDLDTLYAICDRVAVLYDGKLAAIGPLHEVTAHATGWVKEYFSGPRGRAAGQAADAASRGG